MMKVVSIEKRVCRIGPSPRAVQSRTKTTGDPSGKMFTVFGFDPMASA
jgi:hypothetical protein